MGYRIVVVGATGNVGREILNVLAERQFPLDDVAAVASARSTGDVIDFGDSGKELKVQNLEHFDFTGWDMALFAAGSEVSKLHARGGRIRLHGDRQFVALPDGPGCAADRPGSERGRDLGLRQEEHHRQPELLDRAAGGRAEAAARRGDDQAGRGRDLPVGLGHGQIRHGRIVRTDRATSSSAIQPSPRSIPSRLRST